MSLSFKRFSSRTLLRLLAMATLPALLGLPAIMAAADPATAKDNAALRTAVWNSTVTATPDGAHLLGNPSAKVKLTEYISYTCPHCAHFNQESEPTLRLMFVASGKGSVEVRPYIRNAVDMAASLLIDCVDTRHFLRLHDTFLNTQAQWMARFASTSESQRERWDNGPMPTRMRAIAGDLDFYRIMDNVGFSRAQTDHCLNDEAAMRRLAEQTEAAEKAGVDATPSFAIDGVVLTGTNDWTMLGPQLQARM